MHKKILNRKTRRVKRGILAAMFLMCTFGVTRPVQAAVNQNDLAAPVMDAESHTYKIGANPTVEECNQYHRTTYHYVYFGMYPQREITGAELTNEIRNATYDNNGDATVKGRKYRRINYFQTGIKRMNQSDPFNEKDWTTGCTDGYRYFVYEPIRWRILSNNGNTLLLQTEQGIDTQPFSCAMSTDGKDFWAKCDLRKWLNYNGEGWHAENNHFNDYRNGLGFYCYAFSAEEQAKIQTTHLTQDKYPKFDTEGGIDTDDKIFILNYTDLNNSAYGFCKEKRCFSCNMKYTDYGYATIGNLRYKRDEHGDYWIRTLGRDWRHIMYAGYTSGYKIGDGYYYSYVEAVRPATNVSYNLSECFKITFDTGTGERIEPQIMLTGSVAKEPVTPTKNGYTFVGWYTDKNCTKPYDFTKKLNKDTTLYAGWKPTQETIDQSIKEYIAKNNIPENVASVTDATLLNINTDGDVSGSAYSLLQAQAPKTGKVSIKLKWNKVNGADGYDIYGTYCNTKKKTYKFAPIKTITQGNKKSYSYTHKKLTKGTYYKYIIKAYKVIEGEKVTIAVSKTIHATTTGGTYGNAKSVMLKRDKKLKKKSDSNTLTIKKNKKYTIKATEVKKSKKLSKHRKIAFESTDKSIATVNKKGVVKGKKKGTCYIYAYAQNGISAKIKVKVK